MKLPSPGSPAEPASPETREREAAARSANPWTGFLAALQFLVVSPAFIRREFTPRELGAAVGFYPLVGLLLGGLLVGLHSLVGQLFPPLVTSALTLSAWVLLTGALHLDGFLDTCDGLLGGWTPEKRMEIMRDHRVGAYALAGGILLLLVKFSALASLGGASTAQALLLAPVFGRWSISLAVAAFPYGRAQGLGRVIKDHTGPAQVWLASVILTAALAAAWVGLTLPVGRILAAGILAALVTYATARFALARIPGLTGDLYGAVNELVEVAVLLVFVSG